MEIHWSIDGVTRNDYRENVNLNKTWDNFKTYKENGGHVIWQYIEFDYNKDEIPWQKKGRRHGRKIVHQKKLEK